MISEEIVHINGIPKKLIVFLHGYQDTAEHIDKKSQALLEIENVALHIPQAPYLNEIDATKRQWYSMHQFDPDDCRRSTNSWDEFIEYYNRMTIGLEEASSYLLDYIDNLLNEYGLSYEDLFLCGFSQGAMLAIHLGLMCPYKMAGVVSFSGILAAKGYVEKHLKSTPDMLLIHGNVDNTVRFRALEFTSEALEDLGCCVQKFVAEDCSHRIDSSSVQKAAEFIKARI